MKHITPFFLVIIFFCSCNCTTEPRINSKPIVSKETTQEPAKPFTNPSIVYGASFGSFFQALYRTNRFSDMLAFTSSQTISKFGRVPLMNYYKHDFKFDFELGKHTNSYTEGGITYLTYSQASITATRRKIVIPCVVEHDTVRVIIHNLISNPFENE